MVSSLPQKGIHMPIEGSWNTIKAFFLTQALLEEKDRLNNFANESLWYVQYFLGNEVIEQQEDNFYLVQKPEIAGNSSWVPSSLKTAAYFVSALMWIIPGTFARLLSLDSEEVTSAIFAKRITPPPPKAREIPRPATPPSPRPQPQLDSKPQLPDPKANSEKSSTPALETAPKKETAPADAISVAAKAENYAPLVEEVQLATQFFEELNRRTNNPQKLKKWLDEERSKTTYLEPFYLSRHLKWVVERNQTRFEGLIPPETLLKWKQEYEKSSEKLTKLKLQAYLDEPFLDEHEPQINPNDDLQGGINSYKPLFSPTCNLAEWLKNNPITPLLFMTRYWQCGHEFGISLDAGKLTVLDGFYSKCKTLLRERNLEIYLQEKPKKTSPGFYALVCYLTDYPIQNLKPSISAAAKSPAAQVVKAPSAPKESTKPGISDAEVKKYFVEGLPGIVNVPGMQAVLENEHLFQQNKSKLIKYINQHWEMLSWWLNAFLEVPDIINGEKTDFKKWLQNLQGDIQGYQVRIALFAEEHLQAIEKTRSILDKSIYQTWKNSYRQCQQKLKKLHLGNYLKQKIDNSDHQKNREITTEQQLNQTIPFFKDFLNLTLEHPGEWLKQRAMEKEYCYPFFYSFDLSFKKDKFSTNTLQKLIAEWKPLYDQAKLKIESLGLTQYFDEMPPGYIDDLIKHSDTTLLKKQLESGFDEAQVLLLQSNTPSKSVTNSTKNHSSSKPLTVENWKTLFSNPEKVPNRAKRLIDEATEFFDELNQLPKEPEKVRKVIEAGKGADYPYPFFFARFVVFSNDLTSKYEKLCTQEKMQKLRTAHFKVSCTILRLKLFDFLSENPFPEQIKETFQPADITMKNITLNLMNTFMENSLKEPDNKLDFWLRKEISEDPHTLRLFYLRLPHLLHLSKFLDATELERLKVNYPNYAIRLERLGLKELEYFKFAEQPKSTAAAK